MVTLRPAIRIVLLVSVAFPLLLFGETEADVRSLELGKRDAKVIHKSWPWFLAGIGSVYVGSRVAGAIASVQMSSQSYEDDFDDPWMSALPWIGFGVVIGAPFIPALVMSPRETTVFPFEDEVDLDSYRKGYVGKARQKNAMALLMGESVGIAGLVVFAYIVVYAMFGG